MKEFVTVQQISLAKCADVSKSFCNKDISQLNSEHSYSFEKANKLLQLNQGQQGPLAFDIWDSEKYKWHSLGHAQCTITERLHKQF